METRPDPWPAPYADWRARRRSVREAMTSFGALLVVPPAVQTFHDVVCTLAPVTQTISYAAACVVAIVAARFALRRGRFGESERAAVVLRNSGRGPSPPSAIDGERRGFLDRASPDHFIKSAFLGTSGLLIAVEAFQSGKSPVASIVGGALLMPITWIVARHAWQGGVEVRWVTKTLVAGDLATFYVGTPEGGSSLHRARFLLRCIEPVPGPEPVAVWHSERTVDDGPAPGPDQFVQAAFYLPPTAPFSMLGERSPVYWELLVRGRVRFGGTMTESFLVPVRRAA